MLRFHAGIGHALGAQLVPTKCFVFTAFSLTGLTENLVVVVAILLVVSGRIKCGVSEFSQRILLRIWNVKAKSLPSAVG
jgi:hypothetical protein